MPQVLIIGYGNPLRCDDAAGWRVAEALEGKFSRDVEIRFLDQLTPELAEVCTWYDSVIFIDAALPKPGQSAGEILVEEVQVVTHSRDNGTSYTHVLFPSAVLALAETLYGAKLQAFVISVRGENFDHGQSLSPAVARALPELVRRVEMLARGILSADPVCLAI